MDPVFKDQAYQEDFSYCHSTLHTVPKERRYQPCLAQQRCFV